MLIVRVRPIVSRSLGFHGRPVGLSLALRFWKIEDASADENTTARINRKWYSHLPKRDLLLVFPAVAAVFVQLVFGQPIAHDNRYLRNSASLMIEGSHT